MQTIRTTDGQVFKFPDTMTRAQIAEALKRRLGNQTQPEPTQEKDRSFLGAVRYSVDAPLENISKTARSLNFDKTADFLSNLTEAPENYDPASAAFINEGGSGYNFSELPRAAVEQAGQFAGSLATRAAGAAGGFMVGGPFGAAIGAFGGPALFEGLQLLGPIVQERARNNGREEPTTEDWLWALGSSGTSGALNALAPGMSGFFKRAISEGGTEAVQSLVQQVGETIDTEKGLEVSPKQAVGEGIIGSGSVAAVDVPASAAVRFKSAFSKDGTVVSPDDLNDVEKQAAGDLARRFKATAEANNFNLKNINKSASRGARATVDMVHVQLTEDLRQRFNDMSSVIKPNDSDTFNSVRDKILAQAAYREGRSKTKSIVGQQEIDALVRLAGNTREGQEALNLLRQLNQLTELHNEGYQGSLSAFTDQFSIFGSKIGYDKGAVAFERIARPMLSTGAAFGSGGASVPIQLGISNTGRAVDKLTGNYSQINKFVRQNQNNPGLQTPTAPSLRDAQAAQLASEQQAQLDADQRKEALKAARREANLDLVQRGADPTPESPQDIMQMSTGLDRSGVAKVLRLIEATTDNQATLKAIQEYRESISVGRKIDDKMLSPLIRMVNQTIKENPDYVERVREPVRYRSPDAQTAAPTMGNNDTQYGAQLTTPENYNRGIQDNLDFVRELGENAQLDQDLSVTEKAQIATALDNLTNNLGSNPVETVQTEVQKLQDQGVNQDAIDKYVQPYVDRVVRQQAPRGLQAAADAGVTPETDTDTGLASSVRRALEAANETQIDEARIVPVPFNRADMQGVFGVNNPTPGGNYIDLDTKQDLTGNTYSGGTVSIVDGKPILETNDSNAAPATKADGRKVKVNLFKQKAGWKWLDYDGPNTIVSTEVGGKHHYALSSDFQTPVTLQTYPNQPSEPRLRPTTQGEVQLGNVIGNISVRGKEHPVYDKVSIVSKNNDLVDESIDPNTPALQSYLNPLNLPQDQIDATRLTSAPTETDIQAMRDGTYKPKQKRSLVEAAGFMFDKWKKATGRTEPFAYTPENIDVISDYMATEAINALQSDGNAIGWYDRKLKAAKRVVSLIDPRITQSPDAEVAFDYALAITSNGIAVEDNFKYALEVFQYFMDNGKMPADTWIKGGKRNTAMVEAFEFFNQYQASGTNLPIQEFLDSDFTVNELKEWAASFNERYNTNVKVPGSEGANEAVKGSYIAGPKIGQGFYQNIRGNYDPLTMDIWWMRMWNRLTGRPYTSEKDLNKNRARVREALKTKNQDKLEKRLTKETLKDMGITRADLKDDTVIDEFVVNLSKKYQRFYSQESKRLKGTGQKVPKPELFTAAGTMNDNLSPQLQATPTGPGERSYMRQVTRAAIEKLRQNGYMINTADFQALMWYPEKQLFRHLGVAPGRGADNDYLDAAIMLAESKGITDDQIQKALPDPNGDGAVNNQPDSQGTYAGRNPGAGRDGEAQQGEESNVPALARRSDRNSRRASARNPLAKTTLERVKQAIKAMRPAFQIGKKGGQYEDGIQDIQTALKLAEVLGISVQLFNSRSEMQAYKNLSNVPLSYSDTATGVFLRGIVTDPEKPTALMDISKGERRPNLKKLNNPKGFQGTVFALAPSAYKYEMGSPTPELNSLVTILHEISHGMTLGNMDMEADQQSASDFINPLTGNFDAAPTGSFAKSALYPLLMDSLQIIEAGGKRIRLGERNAILQEISDLQRKLDVYTTKNPQERTSIRYLKALDNRIAELQMVDGVTYQELEAAEGQRSDYIKYMENIRETAVDPVLVYLLNPKLAKKLMPKTTALIRSEFDKAKNPKIQFFSHPFAVVAAVVAAMMSQAQEDEERERQQQMMPPGALNQPMMPGALSA